MTVEARKLNFIEEFLKITDEDAITQMEGLLRDVKLKRNEKKTIPMTIDEFRFMIDEAKKDVDKGRVISQEELKQKIQSW